MGLHLLVFAAAAKMLTAFVIHQHDTFCMHSGIAVCNMHGRIDHTGQKALLTCKVIGLQMVMQRLRIVPHKRIHISLHLI